jgi:tetratricopeptide (TPR) repeat protein
VVILLLPLAPVLNLRLMSAEFLLQDRYLYLPSVGFVMLLAPLFLRVPKPAVAALLLLMAIGCGRESRVWSDHEHLFRRALELSPTDLRARDGLARAYARKGNYSEAIVILEPLVQEAQPSARRLQQSLMTLAYSHERLGHLQQAFQYYSAADQLYPNPEIERHLAELKSALDSQPSRWVPQ